MRLLRALVMPGVLFYQSVALALGHIWANKMRAMLTTIGIVIGVASVIAVIAALTGLKRKVLADMESFGTDKLFVMPYRPPGKNLSFWQFRFGIDTFDGMLTQCPSVKSFTRITEESDRISYRTNSMDDVDLYGIDPDWHEIEQRFVTIGRPITRVDNANELPVCLVNVNLQRKLKLPKDCTGQWIRIGKMRYTIIGVIDPQPSNGVFGNNDSAGEEAYLPFNTLYHRGRYWLPFVRVTAVALNPDAVQEAQAEISFFLRKKRGLGPNDEDTFQIEVIQKYIDQFDSVATTITMVAGGIVGISLIVGGVGIMNIMLVSVSERTREIGLRKAVGARPAAILLQFLVEAVTLCLFGGLLGVIGGQLLTYIIASLPNANLEKSVVPLWAVAIAFGFSAVVGLVFGMFPAIKASRLDPIEALRHE